MQDQLEVITQNVLARGYWQQAWIAVRTILSYPNEKADPGAIARLRELELTLRPKNVAEQVRAVVLTASWGLFDYADMDEGGEEKDESPTAAYQRANAIAEELGKKVGDDNELLTSILPELVTGNGGRIAMFGKGLAVTTKDRKATWEKLAQGLALAPHDKQNAGVLAGFLLGLQSVDPALCEGLLDEALGHETLSVWFPALQTTVPITKEGAQRLRRAVTLGKAPIEQFRSLGWVRAPDVVSGEDLREIVLAIAERPRGYAIATDILSMRFHSDRSQVQNQPPELIVAGRELLARAEFDNRDNMHDYRLRTIIDACLTGPKSVEAARRLCEQLKRGIANYSVYLFNYGRLTEGISGTSRTSHSMFSLAAHLKKMAPHSKWMNLMIRPTGARILSMRSRTTNSFAGARKRLISAL